MLSLQEKLKTAPALIARHRISLSIVAALLVIYSLLGFFWLPKFARDSAINYVSANLHRQLTIGEIKFNPFTFTARIRNARLSESDGALIASINELLVNAELSSVWHRAYTFKQVRIMAPVVNTVVNADGSINLSALKPADASPPGKDDSGLPAVRIASLELDQGELQFEDRSRPEPFMTTLKPIKFTLQNFQTKPNYGNQFHFDATSEAGEYFDWQGDFTVQPLATHGRLLVRNLKADTIQDYLQGSLPFRLLAGMVSLQGDYQIAAGDAPDVKLNLSGIEVKDARIAPANGEAASSSSSSAASAANDAWVSLPSLNVNGLQLSLQQHSVTIKQLIGTDAELQAWLDEQHNLNLLTLRGPQTESTGPAWTIKIDDIAFNNAVVHAQDRSVKPAAQFTLQPVQLQVQNYSSAPGATIQLNTTLGIVNSAEPAALLNAQGTVQLDTLSTQLQVKLQQFDLASMQSYAAQATDAVINNGRLNAEGKLLYGGTPPNAKKNQPVNIKFDGQAEVLDLKTQDNIEHNDFIKWQQVQFKTLSFSLAPDQLTIAQISARQPYVRVIINPDATTNVQQILRLKKAQPAANVSDSGNASAAPQPLPAKKPASQPPAMRVRVTKVVIEDGSVNFADNTVKPNFASGIQRLNGTVTNLSSADNSRAKVDLKGQVDNYSPVSIAGEANFLAADTYSDLSMNFRNIDLTIFNPYSGKFAGYSIAKGKLATELRYQIRDRKLDLQHHIVVDQLEFGEATDSKDKVPLPIKLAVALLKDRNGVIDLQLPVTGSMDDPQFKLGPIIWKAFVGLLDRIVTSPFRALGALFGGGEELSYVDFKPGSAELDAEQVGKLDKLGKALIERPQLHLDIPLSVASDADAAALNQTAFNAALAPYLPKSNTVTPQQRLGALTALYKKQLNADPVFSAATDPKADVTAEHIAALERELLPRFAISAADRDELTHQRASTVQMALLANSELSPERIFMTVRPNETQSPDGVVRMALKLE